MRPAAPLLCLAALAALAALGGLASAAGPVGWSSQEQEPLPTMAFALNMRVSDKEWATAATDLRKLLDFALENKMLLLFGCVFIP